MDTITLDVGGQSVKSARVSEGGEVLGERSDPIDSLADAETLLAALAGIIAAHCAAGEPRGVAFAFPGPFDYPAGVCLIQHTSHSGGVKYGALYGVNLRAALRAGLNRPNLPIAFRNDAEAAIVGEAVGGVGRPYRRVIGVTLGTGLGSAFLVDGQPQTSGPGVPENGWLYCLPYGAATADDVFSTRGLLARLREAGLDFTSIQAAAAASAESAAARGAFAAFGRDLGEFLRPYVAGFGADAVVALGGLAEAWPLFGAAMQAQVPVPALHGTLGARAAFLGAAAM